MEQALSAKYFQIITTYMKFVNLKFSLLINNL